MKKYLFLSLMLLIAASLGAQTPQNQILWMRYNSISPDGSTIAFAYQGDIFTVPVQGGRASQITTRANYDSAPLWSPDGQRIAFVSDRMGSKDVFIVDRNGGSPQRITTHSGSETPIAWQDNNTILVMANIMPSTESRLFPSAFSQVYSIDIRSPRPMLFSVVPMENICFAPGGRTMLYQDKKGYEDTWRKHHTSSVTRDIWLCNLSASSSSIATKDAEFKQITSFIGEDRNPVFAPDGKSFYYLSERDGTSNIWYSSLETDKDARQITHYKGNPVRFLSISGNGTLCYGYNGEIYTLATTTGAKENKINIQITADLAQRDLIKQTIRNTGASDVALSNDGKQIAFIYHGDVFVTGNEYATTRRITNTSEQERDLFFAPDGRSLVYSSERDGLWQIYRASIVNEGEKTFTYATDIKEERITNSDKVSFYPKYSPDGKEIAFLEDRTTLRILNLKSGDTRTVLDGKYNYSYQDGDQWFQWSPDSRWILSHCIFQGGYHTQDIALIDASGKKPMVNLTQSGYSDQIPFWVLDGKAMLWFSDRAGFRSHGSWGAEMDAYLMFFDTEAYERFRMNKEDLALLEEAEKARKEAEKKAEEAVGKDKKDDKKDAKKDDKKDDKKDAKESEKVLNLDLENREYRIVRLTPNSSFMSYGVLDKKGEKFYYLCRFEGDSDLWCVDLKSRESRILVKGIGGGMLTMDNEGKTLYHFSQRGFKTIDPASGKSKPIPFEATFEYRPYVERNYIFDHVWRQVNEKFYDPKIHGIDWEGYKETYARYLPYINNNYDFSEMLSELLGELNGSHTGARFYAPNTALPTACLGLFYDQDYQGNGLKIKEVIARSPLAQSKNDVVAGCIIEAIDGDPIPAGQDYFPLLEGKVNKKIRLSIFNPATGKHFDQTTKGMSTGTQNQLLYLRWVDKNRQEVEALSNGEIGYVHIEGMDSQSYRQLFQDLLGRYRSAKAVVVDTRFNGGGWLHDDVVTLLSGNEYAQEVPRGRYIGSEPFNKWTKPSCMLICEGNYSDAHITPWLYKTKKVGPLVGAPVAGTGTAVWWESQIDQSIVFGIPQMGFRDMEGNYLENHQLEPDILVLNQPADIMNGRDTQLEAAVECLK